MILPGMQTWVRGAALLACLSLTAGCCHLFSESEKQPERPGHVSGWAKPPGDKNNFVGYLLLNKGESTDNGEIGVRLVDIRPKECECFTCEPTYPRVIIELFRASDGKVLCRDTYRQGVARLGVGDNCEPDMTVKLISVTAINSKEKWATIGLWQ